MHGEHGKNQTDTITLPGWFDHVSGVLWSFSEDQFQGKVISQDRTSHLTSKQRGNTTARTNLSLYPGKQKSAFIIHQFLSL